MNVARSSGSPTQDTTDRCRIYGYLKRDSAAVYLLALVLGNKVNDQWHLRFPHLHPTDFYLRGRLIKICVNDPHTA